MLFFKNKHLAFEENKAWLENKNLPLRNIKDHKIDQLLKKFYQKYLDHYQTFSFLKQKPYSPNLLNMVQRLLNQNKDVYYQNDQFNKWGYKVSEFVGVKDLFDYEYKSGYWQPKNNLHYKMLNPQIVFVTLKIFNEKNEGFVEDISLINQLLKLNPKVVLIGVCYENSYEKKINKTNVRLDYIITENQIIKRRN